MIAALLLALQVTAPASMTVRAGDRVVRVPLTQTLSGPAVRADLLGPALGARVTQRADGHYLIVIGAATVDVVEHVPFARVGTAVYPLASAPTMSSGRLLVPLQLVSEVLPRVVRGYLYDATRDELSIADSAAAGSVSGNPAGAAQPSRPATGPPGRSDRPAAKRARVVVVDAGHGGPDNGMSGPLDRGPRVNEKDITLAVARQLAVALRVRGFGVVMTRTSDTLIALADRGRIANRNHGDLFLSIHVNAANMKWKVPAATRGFETYFLAEAKTEDAKRVETMENEAVRFETGVHAPKGDPLAFIINDMAQNEHLRESSDLAGRIQRWLGGVHPGPSRGVRQANFAVLRTSFMPAVLIEIGFGTNAADARFLSDPVRQGMLARAIAGATAEYLDRYERRVTTGAR